MWERSYLLSVHSQIALNFFCWYYVEQNNQSAVPCPNSWDVICEINRCCFKTRHLGVVCYEVIENLNTCLWARCLCSLSWFLVVTAFLASLFSLNVLPSDACRLWLPSLGGGGGHHQQKSTSSLIHRQAWPFQLLMPKAVSDLDLSVGPVLPSPLNPGLYFFLRVLTICRDLIFKFSVSEHNSVDGILWNWWNSSLTWNLALSASLSESLKTAVLFLPFTVTFLGL